MSNGIMKAVKPILLISVGTSYLTKKGDEKSQVKYMDKLHADFKKKLGEDYYVIVSSSSIEPANVTFKVL